MHSKLGLIVITWLATNCNPAENEELLPHSIPGDWLPHRPTFNALFDSSRRPVGLYELYATTSEGSYLHRVHANWLQNFTQVKWDVCSEPFLDELRQEVRRRLQALGESYTESYDEEEAATKWACDGSSCIIDVVMSPEGLPTIGVTEVDHPVPDYESLIRASPLAEVAELSAGYWTIEHISCGRSIGDRPRIHIQARDCGQPLLLDKLMDLGFEQRHRVWWKNSIAIQPLSGCAWGITVPAPSFLAGFQS